MNRNTDHPLNEGTGRSIPPGYGFNIPRWSSQTVIRELYAWAIVVKRDPE